MSWGSLPYLRLLRRTDEAEIREVGPREREDPAERRQTFGGSFHSATPPAFQRKWQRLVAVTSKRAALWRCSPSGSLSPRWKASRRHTESLITLDSPPSVKPGFRSVVLGQLGESRLVAAFDPDIAGDQAHARALDADTPRGPLFEIHQRVGTAILFESSGGQTDKVAHLPDLRFASASPR
jgi:hypothetical protein